MKTLNNRHLRNVVGGRALPEYDRGGKKPKLFLKIIIVVILKFFGHGHGGGGGGPMPQPWITP